MAELFDQLSVHRSSKAKLNVCMTSSVSAILFLSNLDSTNAYGWEINDIYRSPLIFNCIVACSLDKRCLSRGMRLYQVIMTLHVLNDVVNDIESDTKIGNYVIIACLKSEPTCGLINIKYQLCVF